MSLNLDCLISTTDVVSGDDSGLPVASLYWNDSVIYALHPQAALLFNFRATTPITLTVNGQDALGSVTVSMDQHTKILRVTIKPNSPTWDLGKATLFFDPVNPNQSQQPNPNGLDPVIINKGKSV